jgi:hypothetical protein
MSQFLYLLNKTPTLIPNHVLKKKELVESNTTIFMTHSIHGKGH